MESRCPECQVDKHQNCDGVANIDMYDDPIPCQCSDPSPHPRRSNG